MSEPEPDPGQKAVASKYLAALAEGKCPFCDRVVEKRQVGNCVYGDCGHRLYQGRLPKKVR